MKSYLLTLLLLFPLLATAQQSPWRVGLEGSSDFYYGRDYLELTQYTGYEFTEPRLNYSARLMAAYSIGRIEINTGFGLAQKDFKGTFQCHVCDIVVPLNEVVYLRYLDVPLGVLFTIIDKKWDVIAGPTLVYNYALEENVAFEQGAPFQTKSSLIGNLSAGVQRPLGKRLLLRTRLAYSHPFNPDNNPLVRHSLSVVGGMYYQFGVD